jgi:hypothetical protein
MVARRWQLLIGWSEFIAGLGGLLMLPIVAYQNAIQATGVYYLGAGVVFAFVGGAGWFLIRGHQFGLQASRWLQAAQILQLTAAGFTFQFTAGFQLLLVFSPGHFRFSPGVNAGLWLGPTIGDQVFRLGLNLFPIIALWGLRLSKPIGAAATAAEPSVEGTA